ncbi:MAG: thiamine phosphate synthase [Acidobacteriia bacterium]|nr:thiamine phosphate synthase [Terriglobia bacterium]
MLLYYITDRSRFPGDENSRRLALLQKIAEAAHCGVDFIQLREKDISTCELEDLGHGAVRAVSEHSQRTRLLINSRTDVAIACGADGVHLRSGDISPADVRGVWKRSVGALARKERGSVPCIALSCHTLHDIERAASAAVDFVVFAPIFEKKDDPAAAAVGIAGLREACQQKIPVLALGGITLENAHICIEAGAAGVAGIRLFQENAVADVVRRLRG